MHEIYISIILLFLKWVNILQSGGILNVKKGKYFENNKSL